MNGFLRYDGRFRALDLILGYSHAKVSLLLPDKKMTDWTVQSVIVNC